MEDTYAVMGDLGNGNYIVRMLVSEHIVDEEFTADSVQELVSQIEEKMKTLAKEDITKIGEKVSEFKSDGQAIALTPEQGA